MKFSKILCALAIGAAFTACDKQEVGSGVIKIDGGNEIVLENGRQTVILDVRTQAPLLNCTLGEGSGWINAKYVHNLKKLQLKMDANDGFDVRTATITLSAKDYTPETITVIQANRDLYAVEDPESYFSYEWDNSWTAENWVYKYGETIPNPSWNIQFHNTYKFESQNWGENGLPQASIDWYTVPVADEYSVGILLSPELLNVIGGKPIRNITLCVPNKSVTYEIIKVKDSAINFPDWKAGVCLDQDGEVLYRMESEGSEWSSWDNYEWQDGVKSPILDRTIQLPTSGTNIMLVAKVKGSAGKLYLLSQPANRFAVPYINNAAAENTGMFPVNGGAPVFSFVVDCE